MKKLTVCLTMLMLLAASAGFCQETPVQKLTSQFLKVIESKSEAVGRKFIEENYADIFLKKVPMSIHIKVLNDLQAEFYKYTIISKSFTDTRATLVINSLITSRKKQLTLETEPHNPQKIFIIDIKDING